MFADALELADNASPLAVATGRRMRPQAQTQGSAALSVDNDSWEEF